jgi:hypothetical protein
LNPDTIRIHNRRIRKISGLETLVNLEEFYIADNGLTDMQVSTAITALNSVVVPDVYPGSEKFFMPDPL